MPQRRLTASLWQDDRGATLVFVALASSLVLGVAALGLNVALSVTTKARLQRAADAGAHAAALAILAGRPPSPDAQAVALANLGGRPARIRIEHPPHDGPFAAWAHAVRLWVEDRRPVLLARWLGGHGLTVRSSATAVVDGIEPACLIALAPEPQALQAERERLQLDGCGLIEAGKLPSFPAPPPLNPYPVPPAAAPCVPGELRVRGDLVVRSGPLPCGGIRVDRGGRLILAEGVHALAGPLTVAPGGRLETVQATLVAGGQPLAFLPGSEVVLRPPITGPTAGVAVLGAPGPSGATGRLLAGAGQWILGAVVLPGHTVQLAGNGSPCLQVIAARILVQGPTRLSHGCQGVPVRPVRAPHVRLVE
ncbi:MAG: hypothetical protein NZM40_10025 [Sphingomonadaceae bacterium]|uniref:hypothetical protein n=1 Tax=Thermaurantiacus sp. TaxID=2820283 RepID=UPI00298F126B|nr:hypothetical protein [Thermaurantiacus sp.]MCS6987741.1 hypothetical protein [Sphingomonadaceae bacterium]MDW8415039.1 hypothetical protein [Thermaurantiacus sp.]